MHCSLSYVSAFVPWPIVKLDAPVYVLADVSEPGPTKVIPLM